MVFVHVRSVEVKGELLRLYLGLKVQKKNINLIIDYRRPLGEK